MTDIDRETKTTEELVTELLTTGQRLANRTDAARLIQEVRATAINEAADKLVALIADGEHDPACLVGELRYLATHPSDTPN